MLKNIKPLPGEQVDPGIVGMQAHSPVHLVVGQDRVVFASLVNLLVVIKYDALRSTLVTS